MSNYKVGQIVKATVMKEYVIIQVIHDDGFFEVGGYDAIHKQQFRSSILRDEMRPIKAKDFKKVKNAAKILDIWVPDWHKVINLNHFDMGNANVCVLAYIFGSYASGHMKIMDKFELDTMGHGDDAFAPIWDYDELTEKWKKQIEMRLEK